jgi:hypothetical protein
MTICCLVLISIGTVVAHVNDALRAATAPGGGTRLMTDVRTESRDYFSDIREALGDWPSTMIQVSPPGGRAPVREFIVQQPAAPRHEVALTTGVFDPRILQHTRIITVEGRLFSGQDQRGPPVAVVNARTADRQFAGDAIGRLLVSREGRVVHVVGVAETRGGTPVPLPDVMLYEPQGLRQLGYADTELWNLDAERVPRQRLKAASVVTDGAAPELGGYRVIEGRGFEDTDDPSAFGVALVNEEAAATLYAGNAMGAALIDPAGYRATIIGIVRATAFRTFQPRAQPTVYFPFAQHLTQLMTLIVQAPDGRAERRAELEARLDVLEGGRRMTDVKTLDEHLHETGLAADRIVTMFLAAFVVLAVVLSAVGASGAIADTVARRSHEIALRSALGASRRSIARQVLTSGVRLAIIGAVVGLVIFATVSLFTEPLPSGARGPGGWWWILTPVGLIVVVLLGGAGPVRRALNIDPASLLRE